MDLYLYVEAESIESPYLTRDFKDEIFFEFNYLKFSEFLNEEETKIVSPNVYGEIAIGKKKPFKKREKLRFLRNITKVITGKKSFRIIDNLFDEYLITSEKLQDRERDPKLLKEVLQKIQNYLIEKSADFPLVHSVYTTKELKDEIYYVTIGNIEGAIEGDLFYYDDYDKVRNKIHVKSYLEDYGKIDFLVEVKPTIQINDISYYTKSISKAEQFEKEFKACYDFLDKAIKANKKVL